LVGTDHADGAYVELLPLVYFDIGRDSSMSSIDVCLRNRCKVSIVKLAVSLTQILEALGNLPAPENIPVGEEKIAFVGRGAADCLVIPERNSLQAILRALLYGAMSAICSSPAEWLNKLAAALASALKYPGSSTHFLISGRLPPFTSSSAPAQVRCMIDSLICSCSDTGIWR
jgi:hypothetical protein